MLRPTGGLRPFRGRMRPDAPHRPYRARHAVSTKLHPPASRPPEPIALAGCPTRTCALFASPSARSSARRSSPSSRFCRSRSGSAPTRRSTRCSTSCSSRRSPSLHAGAPRQPRRQSSHARIAPVRPGRQLRVGLQLSRCSATSRRSRGRSAASRGTSSSTANVAFRGNTANESAEFVSGSYFPVLGVKAALGRVFGVGRRQDARRTSDRRPELRVLAEPARRRSLGRRPDRSPSTDVSSP